MAERLDIVVAKSGDKEAAQGIAAIGTAAEQSEKHLESLATAAEFLKGLLEGLGAALGVHELLELADAYENVENKLRLVTASSQEFKQVEDQLFEASQRSFSSFETNADVYQKLSIQAKQVGINQADIIPLIEELNKAMAASGVTGAQARSGLEELTRGLSEGRFEGRSFLTIIRQVPLVAEEIAKGMGITVEQLRLLASKGQITSQQIIDALKKQAPEIDQAFGATNRSIAQAFTVLQNALVRFVGEANNTTGITKLLAEGIVLLANNINTAATAVAIATGIFTTFKVAASIVALINSLSAAFVALDIAVAPLLISIVALVAAIAGAVVLYEKFSGSTGGLAGQVKELGEKYLGLGKNVDQATTSMDGNYKVIIARQKEFDKEADEAFKLHEEAVKKWQENNKKQFDAYIKDMDDSIKKQQEMEKFTRNAFGDMIEVTSEWARRSGEYFNSVKAAQDGFSSETNKMASSAETNFGRIASAATAAKQAVDSFTASTITGPDLGESRRALAQFGLQGGTVDELLRKVGTSDALFGTPSGGKALQDLVPLLQSIQSSNPQAFNFLKANFGYLFDRINAGGYGSFQTGGSFIVGGSGGPDSQIVQFAASPGERVDILTRGQQQTQGGGGRPIVVQMTVNAADANSFKRSQNQILMSLEAKLASVRGRLTP